ncbi:hypothetical protein RYA05_05600 [Pseudomonas syringae pv. actinidiae]|nr:hypothetical protein [Pseudomonas syringae pv. actinidiae]
MNSDHLYEAVKALRSAAPTHEGSDERGFRAMISMRSDVSEGAKAVLGSCFVRSDDIDSRSMCFVLVDNSQAAIIYADGSIARMNALNYIKSMEKKFVFHVYRNFGIKLDVPKESVITFMSRDKK